MVGDQGTEQFEVTTYLDDKRIGHQSIHDPFIHTTVRIELGRWEMFKRMLSPKPIKVTVNVGGTHGAIQSVMTLDTDDMQRRTKEHLEYCARSREENERLGLVNCFAVGFASLRPPRCDCSQSARDPHPIGKAMLESPRSLESPSPASPPASAPAES